MKGIEELNINEVKSNNPYDKDMGSNNIPWNLNIRSEEETNSLYGNYNDPRMIPLNDEFSYSPEGYGESQYDTGVSRFTLNNRSLEDLRASRQGLFSQLGNNLVNFGVLTATTFADAFAGTAVGVGNAMFGDNDPRLSTWENVKNNFTNNPYTKNVTVALQDLTKGSFPTYKSDRYYQNQEEGKWWKNIGQDPGAFFGESVFENLGFTAGTVLAAMAMGNIFNNILKTSSSRNVISRYANDLAKTPEYNALTSAQIESKLVNGKIPLKGLNNELKSAINSVNAKNFIASTSNALIVTGGEARIEGVHAGEEYTNSELAKLNSEEGYKRLYDASVQQLIEEGLPLEQNILAQRIQDNYQMAEDAINSSAKRVSGMTAASNYPILLASNAIQFGRIFGNSYFAQKKFISSLKDTFKAPVTEKLPGADRVTLAGEIGKEGTKAVIKGNNKLRTLRDIIVRPLSEGMEEISQAAVAKSSEYYANSKLNTFTGFKYNPDEEDQINSKWSAYINGFKDTFSDPRSWEEFTIGALIGAIGTPTIGIKKSGKRGLTWAGGSYGALKQGRLQRDELKATIDQINSRIQDPEFLIYYNGLDRHNTLENVKEFAITDNNEYLFRNADHAQFISDMLMFEKAGLMDQFSDFLDNTLESLNGDVTEVASNIRKLGLNQQTGVDMFQGEDDQTVINETREWVEGLKSKVKDYQDISHKLRSNIGDSFSGDGLEEMIYMYSQIDNLEDRYEKIREDNSNMVKKIDFSRSNKPFTFKVNGEDITMNLSEAMNNPNIFDILVENRDDKALIDSFAKELENSTPDASTIFNNLSDMRKIEETRKEFILKYNTAINNPQALERLINTQKDIIRDNRDRKTIDEIKNNLKGAKTINDFHNGLKDITRQNVRDRILDELDIVDNENYNPAAKEYRKAMNILNNVKNTTAYNEITHSDNPDASRIEVIINDIFDKIVSNSANVDQILDNNRINSDYFNDQLINDMPLTDEQKTLIYDTIKNIQDELKGANKVNNNVTPPVVSGQYTDPEKASEDFKELDDDDQSLVNSLRKSLKKLNIENPVMAAMNRLQEVKDIVEKEGIKPIEAIKRVVDNIKNNKSNTTNTSQPSNIPTQRNNDESNQDNNMSPNLSSEDLKSETKKDLSDVETSLPGWTEWSWASGLQDIDVKHYTKTKQIIDNTDPRVSEANKFFNSQGINGHKYVDQGNLHIGDELYFIVDPNFIDGKYVLLGKKVGDSYQYVGTFNGKYNPELNKAILDEYNKNKGQVYVFPTPTKVRDVTNGRLGINENDNSLSDLLDAVDGDGNKVKYYIAIADDTGKLVTNLGDESGVYPLLPSSSKDKSNAGRVYVLLKSASSLDNGYEYIPISISLKTFGEMAQDMDLNNPFMKLTNDNIDYLVSAFNEFNVAKFDDAVKQLKDTLFVGSKNSLGIHYRKRTLPDGSTSHQIHLTLNNNNVLVAGQEFYVTNGDQVTKNDIDIKEWLINNFVKFNVPFNIKSSLVNQVWNIDGKNVSYNDVVVGSGIMTSNINSPFVRGAYFFYNPLENVNGEWKEKIQESSKEKETKTKTENAVSGNDSVLGKNINYNNEIYSLNNTGDIYDSKGSLVTDQKTVELINTLDYIGSLTEIQKSYRMINKDIIMLPNDRLFNISNNKFIEVDRSDLRKQSILNNISAHQSDLSVLNQRLAMINEALEIKNKLNDPEIDEKIKDAYKKRLYNLSRSLNNKDIDESLMEDLMKQITDKNQIISNLYNGLSTNDTSAVENQTELFNEELGKELEDLFKRLYPEISLAYTNDPIQFQEGKNIFNQEEYNNQVRYTYELVNKIEKNIDRINKLYKQIGNNDTFWNKIQKDFQLNKEQLNLIRESEGNTIEEKLSNFLANYSFTVEINTATEEKNGPYGKWYSFNVGNDSYKIEYEDNDPFNEPIYTKNGKVISYDEYYNASNKQDNEKFYTQYYANLTVPGGVNYTENEIFTPLITPSIKGHAQFSTPNGIGWFRSDTKGEGERNLVPDLNGELVQIGLHSTDIRRILEIQSDLFQKGRNDIDIVKEIDYTGTYGSEFTNEGKDYESPKTVFYNRNGKYFIINKDDSTVNNLTKEDYLNLLNRVKEVYGYADEHRIRENNFLQLLNKKGNWVNFFIKSIVQDSAKKGYSKVLFPSGETAAKIEGHQTISQEIKDINEKLEYVKSEKYKPSELTTKEQIENQRNIDIKNLEDRRQELKTQGLEKLKPIEAFYEVRVKNSLNNIYGEDNVKSITDEYGNDWFEITIDPIRDLSNIMLQRDEANRIIGQANIDAATVLIDAINQKQDTLPHEYAHHYIAWFRDTPIVQEGIKRFGSEEKLVQAIGEQVVKQKGQAYNWWKKFVNWILEHFSNQDIVNYLTDALLTRRDLTQDTFNIGSDESLNTNFLNPLQDEFDEGVEETKKAIKQHMKWIEKNCK